MLIARVIYVSVSLDTTREIAMVLANCNYKAITKLLDVRLICLKHLLYLFTMDLDILNCFFFLKTLPVVFYCYFQLYTKPVYVFKSCNKNIK